MHVITNIKPILFNGKLTLHKCSLMSIRDRFHKLNAAAEETAAPKIPNFGISI